VPTSLSVFPAADAAVNFARDDALLSRARATGEEVIRLYSWERPAVSFGRNERLAGRFTADGVRAAGLDVARRQTGGRALLHHRELTYAIAGPAGVDDTLRATYLRLNSLLAAALQRLGVAAEVAGVSGPALLPDGAPCFATPSPGELVVDGRKLVASAQWREAGAFLQHGSILIDDDQTMLAGAIDAECALPPVPAPATLRALLPRVPTLADLAGAISAVLVDSTGIAPVRLAPEALLAEAEVRTRSEHYRDPAWTWRR
jgi:lipoyl(octanoyl) transferase